MNETNADAPVSRAGRLVERRVSEVERERYIEFVVCGSTDNVWCGYLIANSQVDNHICFWNATPEMFLTQMCQLFWSLLHSFFLFSVYM